jgi:D-amino-acid oxidase
MAAVLTVGDLPGLDDLPPQARLIPDLRPADPAEVPEGFGRGFHARMPLVDMPRYLEYLVERLAAAGGQIEIRAVRSLSEAGQAAPVVVNCSGLGARELAGDRDLRPVFGQHVVLTNPGLDALFLELSPGPEWTSFFPQYRTGGMRRCQRAGSLGHRCGSRRLRTDPATLSARRATAA